MKANTALLAIMVVVVGALLSSCAPAAPSPAKPMKWFQGGTLHRSTLEEWRRAPHRNRLATAADFAVVILKNSGTVVSSTDQLRIPAGQIEICISEVAVADELGAMKASEIAAACSVQLEL